MTVDAGMDIPARYRTHLHGAVDESTSARYETLCLVRDAWLTHNQLVREIVSQFRSDSTTIYKEITLCHYYKER